MIWKNTGHRHYSVTGKGAPFQSRVHMQRTEKIIIENNAYRALKQSLQDAADEAVTQVGIMKGTAWRELPCIMKQFGKRDSFFKA